MENALLPSTETTVTTVTTTIGGVFAVFAQTRVYVCEGGVRGGRVAGARSQHCTIAALAHARKRLHGAHCFVCTRYIPA